MLQATGLGWMWRHEVRWGVTQCKAMGLQRNRFFSCFRGETHKFDKSPFNSLKTPQQLEADHQLGWFTSNTLK